MALYCTLQKNLSFTPPSPPQHSIYKINGADIGANWSRILNPGPPVVSTGLLKGCGVGGPFFDIID